MKGKLKNNWDIFFLYLSICIYPLQVILSAILRYLGFDFLASKLIFILYAVVYFVFIIIILNYPISLKRISSLLIIYLLYFFLYWTSPQEMKSLYFGIKFIMIYVFYLPYSVLIFSKIEDFSPLLDSKRIESCNSLLIICSFLIKYILKDQTGYMPFSYYLLPIWILFCFRYIQKPSIFKTFVFLVLLLEGIVYGARGPLIWLVFSIIFFFILNQKELNKKIRLSVHSIIVLSFSSFIVIGLVFFLVTILEKLNISQSYILNRVESGNLTQSSGRSTMINTAVNYLINDMGPTVNGLFFDRTIMLDNMYVHNVFLETLLDFGWVFGTSIIGLLAYFIVSTFISATIRNRKIIIFLIASFFLKFLLTGSIYEDYNFIIYLSLMFAIREQNRIKRRGIGNLA